MSQILVVEDELAMLTGLKDNLEIEGYGVDTAADGNDALKKVLENQYSLILLDVMLPGISGFDICRRARKEGIKTPIILLTAKGEEIDKVLGLELGADDYITKPFSLRELFARIKAVLRRYESTAEPSTNNIQIGKLQVNFPNYEAWFEKVPVKLTHKEFEFLHYMWNNRNKVISRDDLLDNVWGSDYVPTSRTVDNFILKLRQHIEESPNNPKIILTVHGVGYKLISQ